MAGTFRIIFMSLNNEILQYLHCKTVIKQRIFCAGILKLMLMKTCQTKEMSRNQTCRCIDIKN